MAGLLRAPLWVRFLLIVQALVGLYFVAAVLLGILPVNRHAAMPANGIRIFLTTNGAHAALVVPLRNPAGNLDDDFPAPSGSGDPARIYVMIGWGDARIYPETRVWSDLTVTNAVTGMLGLNGAVMQALHVGPPEPSAVTIPLRVDRDGYVRLLEHIRRSLRRDAGGKPVVVAGASHGRGDRFYEAHGRYQLFYTCNEWVRAGLATAGVRTAMWSPFDRALFYQLRR